MRVVYVSNSEGHIQLLAGELPRPHPGEDELLIKIHAAGVTPTELQWYPTTHAKDGSPRHHAVPGHEFSGVVVSVGSEVKGFSVGDAIYGMNDWFGQGAMAEYCIASTHGIALKPAKLSHIEAAVTPIGALTAWQGLFVHGKLKGGERLLVHGGSGSVGAFVIQLAKMHGADVIATCSGRNVEFLSSLNVDQIIDYETTRFEDVVSNIDMVFDAVGGDSLERSWKVLGPMGRAITIAAHSEIATDPRVKAAFFIVEPDHLQLEDLGPLLNAGYLRPFPGSVISLAQAPDAYLATLHSDERGKSVLVLPGWSPV